MVYKNKLKDRFKSWFVTLGIASVFGLAALGVNAANSYQKASAYDYVENSYIQFNGSEFYEEDNTLYSLYSIQSFGIYVANTYLDDYEGLASIFDGFCEVQFSTTSNLHTFSDGYEVDEIVEDEYFTMNLPYDTDSSLYIFFDNGIRLYLSNEAPLYLDYISITYQPWVEYFAEYYPQYINHDNFEGAYNTYNGDLVFNNSNFIILWSYVRENGTYLSVDNAYELYINGIVRNGSYSIPFTYAIVEQGGLENSKYITIGTSYGDYADSYILYYFDTDTNTWLVSETDVWFATINSFASVSGNFTYTINRSYSAYYDLLNYVQSYNAPQSSGNFITALTSFMSLIGGGIVNLAQTIGAGVVSFASALFIDNGSLSILGGIIGIFAGIALAVGVTSKVYAWISTLGN